MKIAWFDNVFGYTGYAHNVRSVIMALADLGIDVQAHCPAQDTYIPEKMKPLVQPQGDLKDCVVVGRVFADIHGARAYNPKMIAGMLVLEGDKLQESHVAKANLCDQMWATSEFNRRQFIDNGIADEIIEVIPHGVDETVYNPGDKFEGGDVPNGIRTPKPHGGNIQEEADIFRFLFVGGYAIRGDRKGADILVQAFTNEFKEAEKVELTLKINTVYNPLFDAEKDLRSFSGANGRVHVRTQAMAENELADLYRIADCYVVPTKGEGFGMTYAEAMACGLPVIYTNFGGHLDFCSEKYGFPIDVEGFDLAHYGVFDIQAGTRWARPSMKHLQEQMRFAFDNPDECRKKGQLASKEILDNWTWKHAAKKTIEAIEKYEKTKAS